MPPPRGRAQNLILAADEVNCLIYAYLLDSGFEHAAFNLRAEARLDASPHAKTHVERGMLISLLAKALLYAEVESHWREAGMVDNCRNHFTLMRKHVCEFNRPSHLAIAPHYDHIYTNGALYGNKRKAGVLGRDDHLGKRLRTSDPDGVGYHDEYSRAVIPNGHKRPQRVVNGNLGMPIEHHPAVRVLPGNNAEVLLSAWSRTGAYSLVTVGRDASTRLWDVTPTPDPAEFGSTIILLDPPPEPNAATRDINCIEWSPDGSMIVGGSYDMRLRVWDKDGETVMDMQAHEAPIFACRFSPSGKRLITVSLDGGARIWEVETRSLFKEYAFHQGSCLDAAWLSEDVFMTCGSDGAVFVGSVHAEVPIRTFVGHTGETGRVALSTSAHRAATCGDDARAIIWDTTALRDLPSGALPDGFSDSPTTSGEGENLQRTWNASTAQVAVLKGHDSTISQIVWAPAPAGQEQTVVATCSFDCTARLWDVTDGTCLHVITGHLAKCFAACFSPDGRLVVTGAGDASIFITAVKTGQRVWDWRDGRRGAVNHISWQESGDRNLLAICLSRQVAVIDTRMLPMVAALNTSL